MKTIAENLQILKDSTDAIKQAIMDNGGTVTGGLSSYADAINNLFLITFNILEQEYKAKKDMTWEQWVNSEYNTGGFTLDVNKIFCGGESYISLDTTKNFVSLDGVIISNHTYFIVSSGK